MDKKELEKLRDGDQIGIEAVYKEDKYGTYSTGVFKYKGMYVMVSIDEGKWHLSVSANHPLGYYQIKDVRYAFMPNDMEVAQLFPRREEFINVHPNCYHLFQID